MSPMKCFLVAFGLFAWTFSAHAEIIPDQIKIATATDRSIVVAAFPYFPRSVRKTLEGKFSSDDLPIGLLIQNYSDDYLWVLKVKAQSTNDAKNWIVDYYTAYSERPVGAIGGRDFFRNGEELNEWAHEKFHKALDYLSVAQNEVFEHDSFLEAKKAYHGLLFLSLRKKNCQKTGFPDLAGLELMVDVYSFKARKVFRLQIPFSGDESSIRNMAFADWKKESDEYSTSASLPLDDASAVALFSSLSGCIQKAFVGKNLPSWQGGATTVIPKFNYKGDLVSYDLAQSSGYLPLDKAVFSIFDTLGNCKFSEALIERLKRSPVTEIPMTYSFGDSCQVDVPKEFTEKVRAKLQERLKYSFSEIGRYQMVLRKEVVNVWELSAINKPKGLKAQIIVRINKNGDLISAEWEKQSGDSVFDASCMEAIKKASPFPLPPKALWDEAYADGLLFDFDPKLKK